MYSTSRSPGCMYFRVERFSFQLSMSATLTLNLLAISDRAIILANKKIVAQGTPSELINNINAKNFYFGDAFKIN